MGDCKKSLNVEIKSEDYHKGFIDGLIEVARLISDNDLRDIGRLQEVILFAIERLKKD